MADGTQLGTNIGVGDKIWTEDVGSGNGKIERFKLVLGALDVDGGDVSAVNPVPVQEVPAVSGGLSTYHKVTAATTNAANIKNAAGQIYGVSGFNNAAYPIYIKFFDKATAPIPGTDTPIRTIGIEAGTEFDDDIDKGLVFATGIGIAITKGIADNDAVAVALNDGVVNVDYK